MIGKCANREVIAIVENHGRYWIGTNWCWNAQEACPRLPGEDYAKCKSECHQDCHAEVWAVLNAGFLAKDGTLYVIGHDYLCDDCRNFAEQYGIKEIIVGKLPPAFGILSK